MFVKGKNFLSSHAEPAFFMTENQLINSMKDGNITRMGDFRSPAKAVPIRKDKMYYLYIEYENGMMVPLDRQPQIPSPTYLEVYPFTRAIELPSAE